MSSKEQYKDALKSKNKIITSQGITTIEQYKKILILDKENRQLRQLNHQLKNLLSELPKNHQLKKWWQFWK